MEQPNALNDLPNDNIYPNELKPQMLGLQSINSFVNNNSASRNVMFSGHFGQRVTIEHPEEKIVQSGVEQDFGKYTFGIKMPEDGQILHILQRYPKGIGKGALQHNPESIVIYENEHTKELDYFSVPEYLSYHQYFGYKLVQKPAIDDLKVGAYIAKDTVFASSPSVGENNSYMYGLNLNVALMSVPGVAEDGFVICRDVLPRMKFKIYETRVVEFGSHSFPLNIYGTVDNYKPFPDIGEPIREDGIIMILRDYDNDMNPVETSIFDTMEPDFTFDKATYVKSNQGSAPGSLVSSSRVVDIKVVSNNATNRQLPEAMGEQAAKYDRALNIFYSDIVAFYDRLKYDRKRKYGEAKLKLSPKFHNLIVTAMAATNHYSDKIKQPLNLLYKKAPLDEYRVTIVVEHEMIPDLGYKLTCGHGGKGVVVKIMEPHEMPVDSVGNRADAILDPSSTIARTNIGRLYEMFMAACGRDVHKKVREILDIKTTQVFTVHSLSNVNPGVIDKAYSYLLQFYKVINEIQYQNYKNLSEDNKLVHLALCANHIVRLFMPVDNPKCKVQMVKDLEVLVKPTYGPVTYIGESGKKVTTVDNVRIAPLYIMVLDKIADSGASVATGKLQYYGVLTPVIKSEKFRLPYRNVPVRTIGESEARIYAGYTGRESMAEMMDRSNNPKSQRNAVWNILTADKPTNIDRLVDRGLVPLGGARPINLIRHMTATAGFDMVYEPEEVKK